MLPHLEHLIKNPQYHQQAFTKLEQDINLDEVNDEPESF